MPLAVVLRVETDVTADGLHHFAVALLPDDDGRETRIAIDAADLARVSEAALDGVAIDVGPTSPDG